MNYRRGGFRLSIVIAALAWSAFWGWTYYDASRQASELRFQSGLIKVIAEDEHRDPKGDLLENDEAIFDQGVRAERAKAWGPIGLAAILTFSLAGVWIWNGFKTPGSTKN